jgi:hypothetical protein
VTDSVANNGTTSGPDHSPAAGIGVDVGVDVGVDSGGGAAVVTVRDRFLTAGISRQDFEAHLGAGRIAVAGERTRDPATPAPYPTAVAIMVELG